MTKAERLKETTLAIHTPDDLRRIFNSRFDDQMFYNVGIALRGSTKCDTDEDKQAVIWLGYEFLLGVETV